MTDKEQIIIDEVGVLKEKINMCFILLLNKLETPETIEQTIYEHLNAFVKEWSTQLARKTQECEELKEENQKLEMQLCNDCGERDDYNISCKMIRDLDYSLQKEIEDNDRYRKALEEIAEYCNNQISLTGDLPFRTTESDILDIINKAKGEDNEIN